MVKRRRGKDKQQRKRRNLLGNTARVIGASAGLAGLGAVGYTGVKVGKINKAFRKGNKEGFEAFKNNPDFVKKAYGGLLNIGENIGSTIRNNPDPASSAVGNAILRQSKNAKLKLRKGFLESTQLDQKINAQRAAIAHTKTGDLANQSPDLKKKVVDRQRKLRQNTRSSQDMTNRMEAEVGRYIKSGTKKTKVKINPRLLSPDYISTPKIQQSKKRFGIFNEAMLTTGNFGRGKDKTKRKKRNIFAETIYKEDQRIRNLSDADRKKEVRKATLRGGLTAGGYVAGLHGLAHINPTLGRSTYGALHKVKGITIPLAATSIALNAGVGAGIANILKKRRQNQALNRKD